MTFNVNFGSSEISLKNRFLLDSNLALSNFKLSNVNDSISSYFTSDNSLYRLDNTTEVINNFSNVNFAIGLCYLNLPGNIDAAITYLERSATDVTNGYKEGSYNTSRPFCPFNPPCSKFLLFFPGRFSLPYCCEPG